MAKHTIIMLCVVSGVMLLPATSSPAPRSHDARVMEAEIAAAKIQSRKIKREREALSRELVSLSRDLRGLEETLLGYERNLSRLEERESEARRAFFSNQKKTQALTTAMLRFSRVPPEGWMAMPGDMQDVLRTAVALKSVTTRMGDASQDLLARLDVLQGLVEKTEAARQIALRERRSYEFNRLELTAKIARRQDLEKRLQADLDERYTEIASLSKKAEDIQALMQSIRAEEEKRARRAHLAHTVPIPKPMKADIAATAASKKDLRRFADARGSLYLPALGEVVAKFGEKASGRISEQGIEIETRESAEVVAPFGGEIVYTGPFLDYGNIVIIRHDDTYHTLIAGLEHITGVPGQQVLTGEPIGQMGSKHEGLTKLYVELRKNAKPVDPLPWIAG